MKGRYQNDDPFEKKLASQITADILTYYNDKIADCVKRNFYNRPLSILTMELESLADELEKSYEWDAAMAELDSRLGK